ncbi:MAG: AglZ/HisF2 family acetamidino modification protein [Deltaproteobacteria bacterium]|nr:AglZ/HisF2 family acetamidino modification protein [Deltaproteobacteria bacterium]
MLKTRIIPCLLLKGQGLVKTVKFRNPKYVGDPINAVKIFNDKEVDELVLLDIEASVEGRPPRIKLISEIASECFMPLSYGGGLRDLDDIKTVFNLGVEKVIINSYAIENPNFVKEASGRFGSQSVVVAVDVKKSAFGKYEILTYGGRRKAKLNFVDHVKEMEKLGAGEIFLNSIDRDGAMEGYDIEMIKKVTDSVSIPVIACGGAGRVEDFVEAVVQGGASAVAAGSMFVFHGKHRAVLITYPSIHDLQKAFPS